jgi:hypothetical protein
LLTTVYLKEKMISMAKNTNKMALPQGCHASWNWFWCRNHFVHLLKSEANCFVEVMISFIVRSRAYFYCFIKIQNPNGAFLTYSE